MNKNLERFSLIFGFILFFLTIGISSSASILVYVLATKHALNTNLLILAIIGIILFMTTICLIADYIRRKIMVDNPTEKILDATNQIISGNFDVKIEISKPYYKYSKYDKKCGDWQ